MAYHRAAQITVRMRQRKCLSCQVQAASSRMTRSSTKATISNPTPTCVPGSTAEGLLELAHRLVDAVAALSFRFADSTVGVTASVGIARFPHNAADAETLIAAADEALYLSKAEGRNRATVSARQGGESARMPASSSDEHQSRED